MRLFGFLVLLILLASCGSPNPKPTEQNFLGLLKVTVSGIGEGATPTATAEWAKGGVSGQSATVVPVNNTSNLDNIQLSRSAVNFSDDDTSNTRYVHTTLSITNRTTTNFANLILYAVNVPTNIGGTGIASMTASTGAAITDENVARGFQPTHGMRPKGPTYIVNPDNADLALFTPAETTDIKSQAVLQGILTNSDTVLEYGFVARNLSGGRNIAARDSDLLPGCNTSACQGYITLAYKFPRVEPRPNNPFFFTLYFVVANESNSYISQSLEEQSANTVAGLSNTSSFTQTRTICGNNFGTGVVLPFGQIKIAVSTTANPSAMLMPTTTSGGLDSCFGLGGKLTTDFAPFADYATTLAIQSDGKLVVAGDIFNGINNQDVGLVRYNPNGSLDTTFGIGGKVTTSISPSYDYATALAIQSDGKIVAAGYASGNNDFALARYNP